MRTSKKGIDLIKQFEGCRLTAYKCPSGVYTIGYGHTKGVTKGQKISQERANSLLGQDIKEYENAVNRLISAPLNQNQFDALVSFCFNCGVGAFKTSTLRKKLNAKDYQGAANEFPRWNKGGGKVLKGLVKRRAAEQKLFNTPITKAVYYTVEKGDTLTAIAKKHGTTYKAIAKLNNLPNPDKIYIGQKLKIK